jgi:hypothetical protein
LWRLEEMVLTIVRIAGEVTMSSATVLIINRAALDITRPHRDPGPPARDANDL